MMDLLHLALHTLALLGICVTTFCRLRKTTRSTLESVRTAIWLLCCASGVLLIMPVAHELWPHLAGSAYKPQWPVTLFFVATLAVQWATAKHWRSGVPACYQKESES